MSEEIPKPGLLPEEGVFSLDDIDDIIAQEDPTFVSEMEDLKTIQPDADLQIDSIDPDAEIELPQKEDDEKPKKDRMKVFVTYARLYRAKATVAIKKVIFNFKSTSYNFAVATKQFVRHEMPERIKYLRVKTVERLNVVKKWIQGFVDQFKALSRVQKIALGSMFLGSFLAIFLISKSITGGWLPRFNDPLIKSLAKNRRSVKSFEGKRDLQDLFQAFPEVEFYVLLKKVVVNLRPDKHSSNNPMGLYEVYLGLDSQDTAIEIKDREREVLDVIQRTLENFTYTEVSTQVGKIRMKAAVRDQLNLILNQGQVYHVYFNSFVTKQ